MKMFFAALCLFAAASANAGEGQTNCKDPNFNGLEVGQDYSELRYRNRFQQLFSASSPAPAGFERFAYDGQICFATTATYLKHKPSGKMYVMFTTGDDYCDGGNTLGLILDAQIYRDGKTTEGSIVADIGDGEVACRK